MVCPLTWFIMALIGAGYFMSDRILEMILIKSQVLSFVWIIGILALLVLALLPICYRKHGKGGGDDKDE
jgi:hypothetical protein